MSAGNPHQVFLAPTTGLPQDRLFSGIVRRGLKTGTLVKNVGYVLPTGQGPRRLADVVLVVVADSQREQLEELPGQILVGRLATVRNAVEPAEHGCIAEHGQME